jgi:CRP-like cAMP-binding protein
MLDISPYYFINAPFDELHESQVTLLSSSGVEKKFSRGETIFKVNENPKGIFVIQKGRVKIFQTLLSGADQIMNIHVEGEIIGYRPLLCDGRYPVNASALEACTLLFIPAKTFLSMLHQSTALSNLLLRYLSHEFTVWVNTISLLNHKSVKERLLVNILILVAKYQDGSKWPVKIGLSKTDIASLIGTSKETLARVLNSLKGEQLIAPRGRAIEIENAQQFKRLQNEVSLFL